MNATPVVRDEVHVSRPARGLGVGCFICHQCVPSAFSGMVLSSAPAFCTRAQPSRFCNIPTCGKI